MSLAPVTTTAVIGSPPRTPSITRRRLVLAACAVLAIAGAAPAAAQTGGTLRVLAEGEPDSLDSGLAYSPQSWQILANTGSGLMAFRREAGGAGASVVPDLAVAPPVVAAGGRRLTFTLRRDARFSPPLSRRVTATDVKATIERLFRLRSPGRALFDGIRGAAAFNATLSGGIAGITANDGRGTVTIRLTRADPGFLRALALPFAHVVPRSTPGAELPDRPAASAGPYYVSDVDPGDRIILTRNPSYRERGPTLQPGRVDQIEVQIGVAAADAAERIAAGEADYSQSRVAGTQASEIAGAGRAQAHRYVEGSVYYYFMNVTQAPFDRPAVRRAVNLAIDRARLARFFGGAAVPTAQIIPPGTPGYRRLPTTEPDLRRARRMIARAGAAGFPVTVWGHTTEPAPAATRYLANVLRAIGLVPQTRFLERPDLLAALGQRATGAQIGYARWQQDFPDAGLLFDRLLSGRRLGPADNLNYSYFDDPAINRRIAVAQATPDGPERERRLEAIDRALVTKAPWAPFANSVRIDLVSLRVGSHVAHQVFGFLWSEATVGGAAATAARRLGILPGADPPLPPASFGAG